MAKIRKAKEHLRHAKNRVTDTIRLNFWKKVLLAMHPRQYSELSARSLKSGIVFILSLMLASFIVMALVSAPRLLSMNSYIESELSKFSELNISISAKTSEPVMIAGEDPQIIIDTSITSPEMGSEKALVTEEFMVYRPYGRQRVINFSEFKDITAKKSEASRLIVFIFILLIPTLFITAYAMLLAKYAITITAFALVLFAGVRIAKKDLGIKKALNTAIYAATPMIFLEIVLMPFNSKYLVPVFQFMGMNFCLITLLAYALLGVSASYFAAKHVKKLKPEEEYPEVESAEWER